MNRTHNTRPAAACLAALLAAFSAYAYAYDSPAPLAPVPQHGCAWVETKKPDIHTVFLWKFSTAEDRAADLETMLEDDALSTILGEDDDRLGDMTMETKAITPTLLGDAKPGPGAGRFGGGLALRGEGYASADASLSGLLGSEGAITFDLWFNPAATPAGDAEEVLLALPDFRGKILLTVETTPAQAVLTVDGKHIQTAPMLSTPGRWHHLVLTARNTAPSATVTLTVDGRQAEAVPVKALQARLGSSVFVGGAPGKPGFRGAIDEIRLSRGVRYLYAWNLGDQELAEEAQELGLAQPFFKSGQVLTRFHFDGDLKPETFSGLAMDGSADESLFQPGIKGQALDLSRISESGFKMNGFYIIPETNGTVEFWFRPLDWDNFYLGDYAGTDLQHYWLMTLTSKEARHGTPSKNIEVFRGRACRDGDLLWEKIHPGTWTHALISIKDRSPTVYVNGRKQKLWQVGLVLRGHPYSKEPLTTWRERTGGKDDGTWDLAFVPSPTLIDEFSVYSWPLDTVEAWNAYARWLPDAAEQMKPLPVFRVDFDYLAHSWSLEERLEAKLACLPVNDIKPVSADFVMQTESGDLLLKAEKVALDDAGNATFTLKRALPFGRYPVTVRSRDASGAVLKEEKLEYVRTRPDWLDNTLGEDRTVPMPWTPIAVDGTQLRVVDRAITLGPSGLPSQIETRDHNILTAPVAVRVSGPAGAGMLQGKGVTFGETTPDRVSWQATMQGAGLTASLDAWMEFDGLIYCALTLLPGDSRGTGILPVAQTEERTDDEATGKMPVPREMQIDTLSIDFQMNPGFTTQLLANGGGNNFRASWIAKMIPAGDGSVWNSLDKPYPAFGRAHGVSNYMPHVWLGGDDTGLYFGGENDQGWTVNTNSPAQEVLREDDAIIFRMNVIREPVTVTEEGHRFHFVLLPTPAKPEPADWRKQMAVGGVNFGSVDTFGGFDMKTDPTDAESGDSFRLEPRSWEHAAAMAPQCRAKWGRCILYADASWARPGPAFRDWNHDLWAGTGRLAWTPEFEDYVVWCVNEFLRRGLIDGVYWDDVSVGYTYSLASTAYEYAASPNGRRVGFTALAQRRANMRIWRLFEAAGREPCIWAHMTVCYEVPLFSFCRYISNGEFVTGVNVFGKRDAMDFWNPDTLRILGTSSKWGTGVSFLTTLPRTMPDTAAAEQWAYPQRRTENAIYATSDILAWSQDLVTKLNQEHVFDGTMQALPWWKANDVLSVTSPTNKHLLSSLYVLDDRAVVFIANRDREAAHDVGLTLDASKLFPGAAHITWRDLDPGLKPPEAAVASAEEMAAIAAGPDAGGLLDGDDLGGEDLVDVLSGTSKESRDLDALTLRSDGSTAHVLVRPRDYRVLEARPER